MRGNLAIAQLGGPTAVINASLAGILQEAKNSQQFPHIYGLKHGFEGLFQHDWVDLTNIDDGKLEQLKQTPASALGASRYKMQAHDYERVIEIFQQENICHFIPIGGNGSIYVAHQLAERCQQIGYEVQIVSVPKTMDNDLAGTDHTPGYGSAARFLALATRDAGLDLQAMSRFDDVTILETLGRDSGWLAASAALLKQSEQDAPHLVYVPEIPFDEAQFLQDVQQVHHKYGIVFVVVGEGLRDTNGNFVGQNSQQHDHLGRIVYSMTMGVANYLIQQIREALQLKARSLRPSLIGRALSACVSEVDREEAFLIGQQAVQQLCAGNHSVMLGFKRDAANQKYACQITTIPFTEVAGEIKHLPREYMNDMRNMPTQAFMEYAMPLIGNNIPEILRL